MRQVNGTWFVVSQAEPQQGASQEGTLILNFGGVELRVRLQLKAEQAGAVTVHKEWVDDEGYLMEPPASLDSATVHYTVTNPIQESGAGDNVFMNDAPVTVASEGAGSAQGGSTGNAQGGRSTTLPRTGDLGGSALAGGVALAGAALAAYGRRRAEVEREAALDEEGDRD